MKTLEERIKELREVCERKVEAEKLFEEVIPLLPITKEDQEPISITHYSSESDLRYYLWKYDSKVNADLLKEIMRRIGGKAWKREVESNRVCYSLQVEESKISIYILIYEPEPGCTFVKVPTGRVKKVTKHIEVEEAELQTIIHCEEKETEKEVNNDTP